MSAVLIVVSSLLLLLLSVLDRVDFDEETLFDDGFNVVVVVDDKSENRDRYFEKKPKNAPGGINSALAKFPEFSKLSGSSP